MAVAEQAGPPPSPTGDGGRSRRRRGSAAGPACLALLAAALVAGCDRGPSFARVPRGQEGKLAKLVAAPADAATLRPHGFLAPRTVGREIRAQAVRAPMPGPTPPPPAGT